MLTSKKNKFYPLAILFGFILLTSCYENQTGCLDIESSNYDVTADDACDDCCTYPTLSILISHQYGENAYSRTDTITNDLGAELVLEDIQTFISDLNVHSVLDSYQVSDTISVLLDGSNQTVKDDIILVRPSTFRYTVGTFREADTYKSITTRLGLPNEVNNAATITVPDDHPIIAAGDSLYIDDQNQYVTNYMLLRQVGVHDVADTLAIIAPSYTYNSIVDVTQNRGSNASLSIIMDYLNIINGLDYNTMTKEQIIEQIKINLQDLILPE